MWERVSIYIFHANKFVPFDVIITITLFGNLLQSSYSSSSVLTTEHETPNKQDKTEYTNNHEGYWH